MAFESIDKLKAARLLGTNDLVGVGGWLRFLAVTLGFDLIGKSTFAIHKGRNIHDRLVAKLWAAVIYRDDHLRLCSGGGFQSLCVDLPIPEASALPSSDTVVLAIQHRRRPRVDSDWLGKYRHTAQRVVARP